MHPLNCLLGIILMAITGTTACAEIRSTQSTALQHELRPTPVMDYTGLINSLLNAGLEVLPAGEVDQPFFAAPGKAVRASDETIQVFQFASAAAAIAQAKLVSADGDTVGASKPHWIDIPHFYQRGSLIVLYLGDNKKLILALEGVLGRQFAGK